VAAALKVKFTATYPETPPVLSVRRVKGINEEQVAELEELVRLEAEAEELLGSAMVYMLAEKVQEWLVDHNEPEVLDMHSQMIKRQQAEAEAAAQVQGEEEEEEEEESQAGSRLRDRARPAGSEGTWRADSADSAFHVGVTLVTAETFAAWRLEYDAEQAAAASAPGGAVGKKAASYIEERCRLTGRQIFEEVDSALVFDGEEDEDEDEEEDLMLLRTQEKQGVLREEYNGEGAGDSGEAAGEGELLDGVGDEALFDEDEDLPDE